MQLINLIKTNLAELPNSDCVSLGDVKNTSGQTISTFRLLLDKKEMGIFDTLLIRVFPDGKKNYTFSSLEKPSTILGRIKLLVNDLHRIHGNDSSGKGSFNDYDESCLMEGDFWTGRSFNEHKIYIPVTMLSYDSEDGLALTIWNI